MSQWPRTSTLTAMALAVAAASLASLVSPRASAATEHFSATTGTDNVAKPPKKRKAKAPQRPLNKGSGENKAERDKRLMRECQGKPNSGACEGYAL